MKVSIATYPKLAAAGSRLTACAALWCTVHCALTPVLIITLPALALAEALERGMFLGTVALGISMLAMGPGRAHLSILSIFAGGVATWGASLFGVLEPLPEPLTSSIGSLMIAVSLFWSVQVCETDQCTVCAESE